MTVLQTARGDFEVILDGPQNGPLVVLLHGFPELNVSWTHQIPALTAAGYRVLAPNQRGYAGSVAGGSYATEDLAADVVAMLNALDVQRAVIVGHDWGGAVAWTVAQLYPGRVNALVAMNCPPPRVLASSLVRSPRQLRKSWYMLFFQLPWLPERFVAKSMPGVLRGGSHVREAWNRDNLAPYADAFATPADVHGPINWYRGALRSGFRRTTRHRSPIWAPVLVVWGVHDPFLGQELVSPPALRSTLAYPNAAEVAWIESAGHFVQNEDPEAVNRELIRWLRTTIPA